MSSGFGLPLLRADMPPEAVARRGGRMPISGLGLDLAFFPDLAGEADSLFDGLLKHSSDLVIRRPGGDDGLATPSSDAEVIRSAFVSVNNSEAVLGAELTSSSGEGAAACTEEEKVGIAAGADAIV